MLTTEKLLSAHTNTRGETVNLEAYFNAKIEFVAVTLYDKIKLIYYTLVNQLCSMNRNIMLNRLTMLSKHPELAGKILAAQEGVNGLMGGFLVVL